MNGLIDFQILVPREKLSEKNEEEKQKPFLLYVTIFVGKMTFFSTSPCDKNSSMKIDEAPQI